MAKDLFGNEIIEKQTINRFDLEKILFAKMSSITLEEFVRMITNDFNELIEYAKLLRGKKTCQKTSLLFNPHRLTTKTKTSKMSIYDALKTENFISGLARATIFKDGKVSELLYQVLQLGINGVQYVNEFPPHIARDLYLEYGLDANSKILDPCAGWGGRMIGASVVSNSYTCFEPSTKTYNGLKQLFEFIKNMNSDFNAEIHCLPFEKSNLQSNYFDFAFTSPPYYDTEEYSNEETNSFMAYNSFERWCEMFYLPMIEKTMDSLKKDCSFVINIGSRIYPLNEVLINNFADRYEISKGKDRLSGKSGLKSNTKEGETFYRIQKS
jgi:16S rRNA G966 N2-methylase RsmD